MSTLDKQGVEKDEKQSIDYNKWLLLSSNMNDAI